LLFLVRQKLDAQCPESVLLEPACHLSVPLAEKVAPGLLREDNEAARVVRNSERSIKQPVLDEDRDFSLLAHDRASTGAK
jgi:hypothetical protein